MLIGCQCKTTLHCRASSIFSCEFQTKNLKASLIHHRSFKPLYIYIWNWNWNLTNYNKNNNVKRNRVTYEPGILSCCREEKRVLGFSLKQRFGSPQQVQHTFSSHFLFILFYFIIYQNNYYLTFLTLSMRICWCIWTEERSSWE